MVVREIARIYRSRLGVLLAVGLVIFVPLGLLETIDHALQGADVGELGDLEATAVVGGALLTSITALVGDIFYSGVVAALVMADRDEAHHHSMGELARALPYGKLIAIDLLLVLVVALGFVALIVPGLVLLTWFALAAPVAKIEGRGVFASFGRSRQLARRDFKRVFALVIPVVVASQALSALATSGTLGVLGEGFAGEWAGATLAELISTPIFALAVVVLFYELRSLGES
jgi:hypothetical protein